MIVDIADLVEVLTTTTNTHPKLGYQTQFYKYRIMTQALIST